MAARKVLLSTGENITSDNLFRGTTLSAPFPRKESEVIFPVLLNNKPLLWPVPNACTWLEGCFLLDAAVTVAFDECFSGEIDYFEEQLKDEGLRVSRADSGGTINLVQTEDERVNEEGYLLSVTERGIWIKARSPRGIFYGFQSLMQLISNSPDRKIPAVSIADSPFKSVRGVHLYIPPKNGLDWFKRFVDFLAKYRYNTIFLEIGASVRFDSHPEINEAWEKFCQEMLAFPGGPDGRGMQLSMGHFKDSVHIENGGSSYLEKSEFLEIVGYIRKRHMEIVPEVQSMSHAYWMLIPHKDCAERRDDPYPDTYCSSNPKTYDIYFDCLEEVIGLIQPGTVHIGHDEYYTVGTCERCGGKTGHDILAEDVNRIYDWLGKRNIKTMMWGDKFIDYKGKNGYDHGGRERINFNWKHRRNEVMKATYRAVDMVPGDLVIMDWYHSLDNEDTGTQDYFSHRGMDVVFGNFDGCMQENEVFCNLDDRLRRPNVLGAELSLWHEVSDRGLAMRGNFFRYLDVANILWYEGYRSNTRFQFSQVVAALYPIERDRLNGLVPASLQGGSCECINLSQYCNRSLSGIKGLEFVRDAVPLPYTPPFDLQDRLSREPGNGAVCISAGGGPEGRVGGIKVNGRYRSLAFLHFYSEDLGNPSFHGCTYIGWEKEIVGRYIVQYADGSEAEVLIEYSRTITALNKEFGAHWANPAYRTMAIREKTFEGVASKTLAYKAEPRTVFCHEWQNPHPDREIGSIAVEHDGSKPGEIVLLGLTGII